MSPPNDEPSTGAAHDESDATGSLDAVGLGDPCPAPSSPHAARRWLYRGLDLSLPRGRVIAIVGANGAGKSTLLRRLAGLERPHEGEVRWRTRTGTRAEPILAMPPRRRARRLAYLPQHTTVPDDLWVRDVVALGRVPYMGAWGRKRPEDVAAIDAAIAAMDLRALETRTLASLSGGERQRALVARMIAVGAPVWFLDEPTTALDVSWSTELLATFRQMAREGRTLVMAMHGIDSVIDVADDVLLLGATEHAPRGDVTHDRDAEPGAGRDERVETAPAHVFGPAATTLSPEHLRRTFGIDFEEAMVLRPRLPRA